MAGTGFLDLSAFQREAYFRQMDNCLIPGYTGHCPMLKFRFGKTYGVNTREIIKELRDRGVVRSHGCQQGQVMRAGSGSGSAQPPRLGIIKYGDMQVCDLRQRARPFVLGYTGFIPGMSFRFGTSFGRAADATLAALQTRSAEQAVRRAEERELQERPGPPQLSIRGRDVLPEAIAQPAQPQTDRYNDTHISAALPPIAGYTGHIPRLKGTEASLSQRYHTAVTQGLRLLQQEQQMRGTDLSAY